MVSNRSLAQIAEQYGLPEMFIANASSKYMIQAAQKAKGSLFEAYVAGVYYSFLMPREDAESEGSGETVRPSGSSGDVSPKVESEVEEEKKEEVSTVEVNQTERGTGIDDLFSLGLKSKPQDKPVIPDLEIAHSNLSPAANPSNKEEDQVSTSPSSLTPTSTSHSQKRTHGQAFDHLCSWLWPLFTPVAEFLSTYLETESSLSLADNCPTPNPNQSQNVPNEWKIEDTNATGAIGALNQYLGKTYGCGYLQTWITKKRVMDVWRMVCIVRTPEGKEW